MNTLKKIASQAICTVLSGLFLVSFSWAGIPIEHWTQPSGAKVFLASSPGIPMVDVQIDFDAGSRRDPVLQAGLASITASLAGKGVRAGADGAPALDENALGEAWADLGASFGGGAGNDRMSFSLRSLTYPDLLAKATQLAARQLGEPAFPEAIWARERSTLNAALKEANTRPATLVARAFNAAVYGQHPYGFEMSEATLGRIQVADMQTFYRTMVQPCRAVVTVVGAVDRAQADALVSTLFARLALSQASSQPGVCPALPTVGDVAALEKPQDLRIAFDSAQAHVLIGQPGFKRNDPDFFALTVGNYILGGGGFVSRLTHEVREKRGLSYSVYSYFAPGLHAGAFTLGLQTRPDQAAQAVKVSKDVVAEFVANGPLDAELKAAKDNLIGGFALRVDSNRKLLDNIANMAWNQLPLNYLDTWTQQIDLVSAADIKAAFARKLQPQKMVTVVLGAGE